MSETKAMLHVRSAPWQLMDGSIMLARLALAPLAEICLIACSGDWAGQQQICSTRPCVCLWPGNAVQQLSADTDQPQNLLCYSNQPNASVSSPLRV